MRSRHKGRVILSCDRKLTREGIAAVEEWWKNPAVRAAYLPGIDPPNRLYGAQINADGDAV